MRGVRFLLAFWLAVMAGSAASIAVGAVGLLFPETLATVIVFGPIFVAANLYVTVVAFRWLNRRLRAV